MDQPRGSFAALTGAAFVALAVVSFVVGGDTPNVTDPTAEIVAFYTDNATAIIWSNLLLGLSAVFFLFFTGILRRELRSAEGPAGWLSAVAFGGGIVAAVGILIFAGLGLTLGDAADQLSPSSVETLNAVNVNLFLPVAGGIVALLFAAGLAVIRTRALPLWLGWTALVIAVASFTPIGFFAFLASLAWFLMVSIALTWRRSFPGGMAAGARAPSA